MKKNKLLVLIIEFHIKTALMGISYSDLYLLITFCFAVIYHCFFLQIVVQYIFNMFDY